MAWIYQLDKCPLDHACLLVSDASVEWSEAFKLFQSASRVFRRVEMIDNGVSHAGWPCGANSLFKTAAQFMESRKIGPWFWMEPDCIPIKPGWADQLEAAYKKLTAGSMFRFVGAVMEAKEPGLPREYLAGCAMYPADAWTRMSPAWREDKAFDVATAPATIPFATHTSLIQHFWGKTDLPPTFAETKTKESPLNTFTRENLNPDAVVFHRNKDGTLLNLLGGKRKDSDVICIDVVFPFCAHDAKLMLKNMRWMSFLHGRKSARAVLLADSSASSLVNEIMQVAGGVFSKVTVHRYSSAGYSGWPAGPNRAFQEACRYMASIGSQGWLWHEADAVAVRPDWLEWISFEYARGGKPFMGTIIDHMGHMNGIAVYPGNTPDYLPSLMKCREAWDVYLQHEIRPHRHRANHLIQHYISPPSFNSAPDLSVIGPMTALFHPDKTGNLINRLLERV